MKQSRHFLYIALSLLPLISASALAQDVAPRVISTALLPEDLSPWKMFMHADLVVKAVMIGLAFASLVTWTVWLAKNLELQAVRRQAKRDLAALLSVQTLAEGVNLMTGRRGLSTLAQAAQEEVKLSGNLAADGVKERVVWQMERIEAALARHIARGTGVLATIGATAPFVGLFGTVWGIMNSFTSIAQAKDTSLAVVAPGIAEALFATALGLAAAIPAVIAYNQFSVSLGRAAARIGTAVTALAMRMARGDVAASTKGKAA